MKRLLLSALLSFAASIASAAPIPLFDGHSFAGWEGDTLKTWRIQDGAIVGGSLTETVPHNEFLATTRAFTDFELRLKFKLVGKEGPENAGVQIRSVRVPNHFEMSGYQADLGEGWWGSLYDESRRNKVLAKADPAVIAKVLKREDWNDYRIRCERPRIQLWINGAQTVDYTEADPKIEQRGLIALQIHGGAKAEASYKEIVVEELGSPSAAFVTPESPIPPAARAAMIAGFEQTIADTSAALARTPDAVALYSQRGDAHLFLGHFAAAVADFEKMIALDPAQDAPHWRLGIAYYFAGRFAKSARQFEKYHPYDGRDRENGIWKFLAQARAEGVEKARAGMLEYTQFDREPFPALYEMFAGRKTGAEVFAEMEAKKRGDDVMVQFFAHYYVGVNEDLLGRREAAREHLRKAVSLFPPGGERGGPGYMWQAARLHLESLTSAKTE